MTESNTPAESSTEPRHPASEEAALADEIVSQVVEGVVVDDETKAELVAKLEMVVGQVQAPIPPAFMLKDWAEIIPDAPERILRMAEEQGQHRRDLERRVIGGGNIRAYTGQVLGFVLAIAFGVMAFVLIMNDHPTSGTILGTFDLVALVSVFVIGQNRQRSDTDKSRAALEEQPPE